MDFLSGGCPSVIGLLGSENAFKNKADKNCGHDHPIKRLCKELDNGFHITTSIEGF